MPESISVKDKPSSGRLNIPRNEVGQPRIVTSSQYVQDLIKDELKMPKRMWTFDTMMLDDAVANSVDVTLIHALKRMLQGGAVAKTKKGDIAAEFINYNLANMSFGTWMEAILNASTFMTYGFSILNIVTEVRKYGKYKGNSCIKKLAPRDQKSLYGWLWDKNKRDVLGFIQKPMLKGNTTTLSAIENYGGTVTDLTSNWDYSALPVIKNERMLHFRFNTTNNNPQGRSPLVGCYQAWSEKKILEQYTVIGVSKDLSGIVVLRVPPDLIEKGNDATNYPREYGEYVALQQNAVDLHAGKSSFLLLSSETDDLTKKYLYDFNLQGIDGSGSKQFDLTQIVDARNKSIYNSFGCGHLLLGQDGVGSYALSTNMVSTHAYFVERVTTFLIDVINTQLIPRLLAVNDIYLDSGDMPYYEAGDSQEPDNAEISKLVQRMKSVNALTPQALESIYRQLGWPLEGIEDLDFEGKGESRSGESGGTSGTGKAASGEGNGDNNLENSGNKSLNKDIEPKDFEPKDFEPKDITIDGKYAIDMKTGLSLGKV